MIPQTSRANTVASKGEIPDVLGHSTTATDQDIPTFTAMGRVKIHQDSRGSYSHASQIVHGYWTESSYKRLNRAHVALIWRKGDQSGLQPLSVYHKAYEMSSSTPIRLTLLACSHTIGGATGTVISNPTLNPSIHFLYEFFKRYLL